MRVRNIFLALIMSCAAEPASAQDGVYVIGGFAATWRAPAWGVSPATPEAPPASPVAAVTIGGGAWLGPLVAVEGTLTFHRQQSLPWHYGYLFDNNSDQLATDRDLPLVGYVRIVPVRARGVSVETLLGAGINWHRGESFVTADCGPGSKPHPCVPVTPPVLSDTLTTGEWLLAFGVDVPVRVSSRAEVAPGFRFNRASRRQFLTGYDHRGPISGGGNLPGLTISLRYRINGS